MNDDVIILTVGSLLAAAGFVTFLFLAMDAQARPIPMSKYHAGIYFAVAVHLLVNAGSRIWTMLEYGMRVPRYVSTLTLIGILVAGVLYQRFKSQQ